MNDAVNESSGLTGMWRRLSTGGRWGLVVAALVCVLVAGWVLWWSMRTDYQVLFTNLEEADASSVVTELKSQKIPYRLNDAEGTISVPAGQVYATRLSLMSGGVPLTGGVGFEIFDRQSLGATEQSQRVAYQRALQGELARTIGALEHVRQARVLLVLAESTLFKRDQQKPRAAVSLVLDAGAQLSSDQVVGVQRLVAASVAGMDIDQVVVTDQRGLTLSAPDASALNAAATGSRLKLKTELEEYFSRKIYAMLEKVVGTGKAIVTVDATLNFDQINRSLQTLVPLDSGDSIRSGGVLKRRETRSRPATGNDEVTAVNAADATSSDLEYEFGKRLEQVAAAPGALTRLSVSLIVPGALTEERESRLQHLIRAAAGIDATRGDTIVVESLDRVSGTAVADAATDIAGLTTANVEEQRQAVAETNSVSSTLAWLNPGVLILVLLLVILSTSVALLRLRAGRLSPQAREELLADIVATLERTQTGTNGRI